MAAAGVFRNDAAAQDLGSLERKIAGPGGADAATWNAYGKALSAAGKPGDAADAFQKAIALDPSLADARLNAAIALAQAGDADAFFAYINRLTQVNAKLSDDLLLNRKEIARFRDDPRFAIAENTAHAQAQD